MFVDDVSLTWCDVTPTDTPTPTPTGEGVECDDLVDNVLFGSSIALKSYLRKISTPEDLTGCLSFGMSANHVTAVVIPVAGGVAWSMFGHEATFIAGAVIVFVDMLFALKVPKDNG